MSLFIEDPTPTSGAPVLPARSLQGVIGPPGEGLHEAVAAAAERHGLDPAALDWHLEAVHGMERHDRGYTAAIEVAVQCMLDGGCETGGAL